MRSAHRITAAQPRIEDEVREVFTFSAPRKSPLGVVPTDLNHKLIWMDVRVQRCSGCPRDGAWPRPFLAATSLSSR